MLLSGSIPKFPRNGSLKRISLRFTNFSGSIPDSISNLQNLSRLDLSECKHLSGSIPSTISNLTNLAYLDFSNCSFTGSIPYFRLAKKLTHLDLSTNGLTGHLSPTHFDGLSELGYINLGNNSLSGNLPRYIFELPSLRKLILFSNEFVGPVEELHNTSSLLEIIDLNDNHLNGSIPMAFFEIESLRQLSLSSNFFSGRVSLNMIGKPSNLEILGLSYNNLTIDTSGSNSITFASSLLSTLSLASCRLQMFPELQNQLMLTDLDLSDNQIQGPIPNWIWEMGLVYLNLSFNQLEYLERPYNVSDNNIVYIDLHSNKLKGDLPVPPLFSIYVDFSSNNFINSIPLDFGNSLDQVSFLSIANNKLTGRIPESICDGNNLEVLDFSNNSLSGEIPPCLLEKNRTFGVLNLRGNKLHGVIPDSFAIGCALQTLDLSDNMLQGRLPKSLVHCDLLEVLNVGHNRLVDAFPYVLRNSSNLRVLVLRSNGFYGNVQCDPAGSSWRNLQIIDVASNKFTGELSAECFTNWNGMMNGNDYMEPRENHIQFNLSISRYFQDTVQITIKGTEMKIVKILRVYTSIDLSSNAFRGMIPEMIGNLSLLYALNLSHNTLEGPIPRSIGKLKNLESLDLSYNQLSGKIPIEFASLTFLSYLDLSFNKLFGRIPPTSQFATFSSAAFEGNRGLCGFPLDDCNNDDDFEVKLPPPSQDESDFKWEFVSAAAGYGIGAASSIVLLWYYNPVKKWFDKYMEKCLLCFSTNR